MEVIERNNETKHFDEKGTNIETNGILSPGSFFSFYMMVLCC